MSTSFWTPKGEITMGGARRDSDALQRFAAASLRRGADGPAEESEEVKEMRKNRRINRGLAKRADLVSGSGGANSLSFATGRPQDPMFYWKQNNLPYDIWKEEELVVIRHYARLLYLTHPLLASAIDIMSKYPMQGMEITCKDDQVTDFYGTLFIDDLGYDDYLVSVLHEYWLVGEAWPFGQWNPTLGIWEDDELLNPDDIDVIKTPFQKEPRFEMRLPETLRKILKERQPEWEYKKLVAKYPELLAFVADDARMPVSNLLLKQVAFRADTFHPRGVPILMRAFRSIFQEEMLNAAQDAIASRLYTPLILAKIGASATDLGTQYPFIPTAADLADFEEALDEALSADFRVLTHHFALDMESVFGREVMPDLTADFERIAERELMCFGMSKTLLNGAGAGETYAADSLNLDMLSQNLIQAQKLAKRLFRDRAMVVAEAQQHWDYEIRGGKKYPIMEEILERDEETGEERIIQQPKLLIPELHMKSMDMKNDTLRRQLLEELRESGVPISQRTRMQFIEGVDFEDELEKSKEEAVMLAVSDQQARKETWQALKAEGLPIQPDLDQDFTPKARDAVEEQEAVPPMPMPNMAMQPVTPTMAIAPTPDDYAMAEQGEDGEGPPPNDGFANSDDPSMPQPNAGAMIIPLPQQKSRPPESDERRKDMPKASFLERLPHSDPDMVTPHLMTTATQVLWDESGEAPVYVETQEHHEGSYHLISGPRHIGSRRYLVEDGKLDPKQPLDDVG